MIVWSIDPVNKPKKRESHAKHARNTVAHSAAELISGSTAGLAQCDPSRSSFRAILSRATDAAAIGAANHRSRQHAPTAYLAQYYTSPGFAGCLATGLAATVAGKVSLPTNKINVTSKRTKTLLVVTARQGSRSITSPYYS